MIIRRVWKCPKNWGGRLQICETRRHKIHRYKYYLLELENTTSTKIVVRFRSNQRKTTPGHAWKSIWSVPECWLTSHVHKGDLECLGRKSQFSRAACFLLIPETTYTIFSLLRMKIDHMLDNTAKVWQTDSTNMPGNTDCFPGYVEDPEAKSWTVEI